MEHDNIELITSYWLVELWMIISPALLIFALEQIYLLMQELSLIAL